MHAPLESCPRMQHAHACTAQIMPTHAACQACPCMHPRDYVPPTRLIVYTRCVRAFPFQILGSTHLKELRQLTQTLFGLDHLLLSPIWFSSSTRLDKLRQLAATAGPIWPYPSTNRSSFLPGSAPDAATSAVAAAAAPSAAAAPGAPPPMGSAAVAADPGGGGGGSGGGSEAAAPSAIVGRQLRSRVPPDPRDVVRDVYAHEPELHTFLTGEWAAQEVVRGVPAHEPELHTFLTGEWAAQEVVRGVPAHEPELHTFRLFAPENGSRDGRCEVLSTGGWISGMGGLGVAGVENRRVDLGDGWSRGGRCGRNHPGRGRYEESIVRG
eukprot:358651-Chlamydomonas_euryale.AAC.3